MAAGGVASATLEVRDPPAAVWAPLTCALTWIRWDHAVDIDELLIETRVQLGVSEDDLRAELRRTWQGLADQGTADLVRIRGRPLGEREERELGHDDLRNCRWLSWKPFPRGPTVEAYKSTAAAKSTSHEVRVGRYEDSFLGEWERLRVGAVDFVDVVVSRKDLLKIHPRPLFRERKLKSANAAAARAEEWLEGQLTILPVKSRTKNHFVERMQREFDLGPKRASIIWKNVTQRHEAWRRPGRPPKTPS